MEAACAPGKDCEETNSPSLDSWPEQSHSFDSCLDSGYDGLEGVYAVSFMTLTITWLMQVKKSFKPLIAFRREIHKPTFLNIKRKGG
jgi:hypothetical protein